MLTEALFILADNQDITRSGVRCYLDFIFGQVQIVEVANKASLIAALMRSERSVVVLDYTLFDLRSMDELLVIQRCFAGASWIFFSAELSEHFIHRMGLEKNISMILMENSSDEIYSALRCAKHGERFLCHQVTNLLLINESKRGHATLLTVTNVEVLKLIAHGKSVKEIAFERNSSIHTIVAHKKTSSVNRASTISTRPPSMPCAQDWWRWNITFDVQSQKRGTLLSSLNRKNRFTFLSPPPPLYFRRFN